MNTDVIDPGMRRIIDEDAAVDRIPAGTEFGEGPVWFAPGRDRGSEDGYLLWTDIIGDKIMKFQPGVGVSVFLQPATHPNGMTRDRQGRLIVCSYGDRTVWRLETDGTMTTLASHYDGKKINTPNDVVVKSDGAIYWTDATGGLTNPGMGGADLQQYLDYKAVFRLSADGKTITPLFTDNQGPNGIAFSPDESVLYVNDTRARYIRAFDVKPDGSVTNGRVFYQQTGLEPGIPDGMKCDVEGNVYCTGPGGVHVLTPTGKLLGVLRPPEHVSNFAWGGDDWRTLYMTGRHSLYRVRLNIPGVPVYG